MVVGRIVGCDGAPVGKAQAYTHDGSGAAPAEEEVFYFERGLPSSTATVTSVDDGTFLAWPRRPPAQRRGRAPSSPPNGAPAAVRRERRAHLLVHRFRDPRALTGRRRLRRSPGPTHRGGRDHLHGGCPAGTARRRGAHPRRGGPRRSDANRVPLRQRPLRAGRLLRRGGDRDSRPPAHRAGPGGQARSPGTPWPSPSGRRPTTPRSFAGGGTCSWPACVPGAGEDHPPPQTKTTSVVVSAGRPKRRSKPEAHRATARVLRHGDAAAYRRLPVLGGPAAGLGRRWKGAVELNHPFLTVPEILAAPVPENLAGPAPRRHRDRRRPRPAPPLVLHPPGQRRP